MPREAFPVRGRQCIMRRHTFFRFSMFATLIFAVMRALAWLGVRTGPGNDQVSLPDNPIGGHGEVRIRRIGPPPTVSTGVAPTA